MKIGKADLDQGPNHLHFTSLMADLRQDINRVSPFSRCFNGTFLEGIAQLKPLTQMRRVTNTNLLF